MNGDGAIQVEAFEGAMVRPGRSVPTAWNDLTYSVIGCPMRVHIALGPGFPERLYAMALLRDLERAGIDCKTEVTIRVKYQDEAIGGLRIDLLIADLLVLELKAVEAVHDLHLAQLVAYLRAGSYPLGLLINFNTLRLKDGIYRRINADAIPP